MQILSTPATPATPSAAAPAASTLCRPAEESWVLEDGVSLSSADLAAGKANVPAGGLKASYTYLHGALQDVAFGAGMGALAGGILPGIIIPFIGFALAPLTMFLGGALGAFAGAVADHHSIIDGTLQQTPQGLVFQPTDDYMFGPVNIADHARAPVGDNPDAWYLAKNQVS